MPPLSNRNRSKTPSVPMTRAPTSIAELRYTQTQLPQTKKSTLPPPPISEREREEDTKPILPRSIHSSQSVRKSGRLSKAQPHFKETSNGYQQHYPTYQNAYPDIFSQQNFGYPLPPYQQPDWILGKQRKQNKQNYYHYPQQSYYDSHIQHQLPKLNYPFNDPSDPIFNDPSALRFVKKPNFRKAEENLLDGIDRTQDNISISMVGFQTNVERSNSRSHRGGMYYY